jgi:hypothetical protein
MFSKRELLEAIDELEASPATYQNAEKLATFYSLYDHLYIEKEPMNRIESVREVKIDRYGDSEFLEAITDKNSEDIWMVMDELMSTLQALNPRLYQATIDRIKQ